MAPAPFVNILICFRDTAQFGTEALGNNLHPGYF